MACLYIGSGRFSWVTDKFGDLVISSVMFAYSNPYENLAIAHKTLRASVVTHDLD